MQKYRTQRSKRHDHCPQCGDIDFICTQYIMNDQIYLYEEQCPRCHDFWQVGLDDYGNNHQLQEGLSAL